MSGGSDYVLQRTSGALQGYAEVVRDVRGPTWMPNLEYWTPKVSDMAAQHP